MIGVATPDRPGYRSPPIVHALRGLNDKDCCDRRCRLWHLRLVRSAAGQEWLPDRAGFPRTIQARVPNGRDQRHDGRLRCD
jgi:hypothetical protein